MRAASTLGANRRLAFWQVVFSSSRCAPPPHRPARPVASLGFFITPARWVDEGPMIGQLIILQINELQTGISASRWPRSAASTSRDLLRLGWVFGPGGRR